MISTNFDWMFSWYFFFSSLSTIQSFYVRVCLCVLEWCANYPHWSTDSRLLLATTVISLWEDLPGGGTKYALTQHPALQTSASPQTLHFIKHLLAYGLYFPSKISHFHTISKRLKALNDKKINIHGFKAKKVINIIWSGPINHEDNTL